MRKRLLILSLLSWVYALILVHNLTPHTHGNNHQHHQEQSPLAEWFSLFFGDKHEDEVETGDHLNNFRLEEDHDLSMPIAFSMSPTPYIVPSLPFFPVRFAEPSFLAKVENCSFLTTEDTYKSQSNGRIVNGRAPPYCL